jgi:hypothetical protein
MTNEYEIVINYFLKRNIEEMGYLRYKYFKNLIKFCFTNFSDYNARKIFNIMERLKYFKRKKVYDTKRAFEYKFINPYVKENNDINNILYFD